MRPSRRASRPLALALSGAACAALGSCTDAPLEYPEIEIDDSTVDAELAVTGSFCSSPAADVAYPVKVMFVIDGSGSQQFTDQNRQRVVAVENAVNALIGQPNVYFKIVVFNASVSSTPPAFGSGPVFTNDLATLMPGLVDLGEADTLTDYQGVLATAYAELQRDIAAVRSDPTRGPAELARTKYVVIFISDGFPDPQCRIGLGNDFSPNFPGGVNLLCEDQDFLYCLLQLQDPVLGNTTCVNGVCDFNGTLCYEIPDAATLFGGLQALELSAGNDYNQPYQILQKVQEIMDLADRFDVGELRVHTGLVFDPEADPAIIAIFGDPRQAIPLMQEMADLGDGLYMEFYGGDAIDFLSINYDTLEQPRVVRGFFAENRSAVPGPAGIGNDTDADGLTDAEELDIGTSPRAADTDLDGFGDAVEWLRRAFGLDPLDGCLPRITSLADGDPSAPCDPAQPYICEGGPGAYLDTDGDGLHDCEERRLGTDPFAPDTDHDGIPDRPEALLGLDPRRWDFERDDDGDGIPNGREVEWHVAPRLQQSDAATHARYRYDRPEMSRTVDGRPCYDFAVRHIELAPTGANDDLGLPVGYNDVRLYIVENMADDLAGPPLVRTACIRARYVPPRLKAPASGEVRLAVTDPGDPRVGDRDQDERFFQYLVSDDPIFGDPIGADNVFDPAADCVIVR